jgi:hypothetical protein
MVLIDLKLIGREWKKILLIAFLATIFLFFGGTLKSDEQNIFVFAILLFGLFIGVSAFWTGGSAIFGFVVALKLLIKQKKLLKDKERSKNLPIDKS